MIGEAREPLVEAARRLAVSGVTDAIALLVLAWREARFPALGERIDRLSAELAHSHAEPSEAAAIELPGALGSLLAALTREPERADPYLPLLAVAESDPRVAMWLVSLVESEALRARTTPSFWRAALPLLVVHGDARVLRLQRFLGQAPTGTEVDAHLGAELTEALTAVRRTTGEARQRGRRYVGAEEHALRWVEQLAEDPARRRPHLDEAAARRSATLLERVRATPDDDAPRLAYAAFLLENGDGWGEFIALQCAGGNGDGARQWAHRFVDERAWQSLIPFEHVVLGPRFARGFLDRCTFHPGDVAELRSAVGHPLWATLRSLDGGNLSRYPGSGYLLHPVMAAGIVERGEQRVITPPAPSGGELERVAQVVAGSLTPQATASRTPGEPTPSCARSGRAG